MADPSLLDALLRVSMRATAIVSTVGAEQGLSLSQMRIFSVLRDHEPTMGDLAEHLGVDRSSVSGLIDRAAARDLLERFRDSGDRRIVRVRLTEAGRTFAARLESCIRDEAEPLLDRLGVEDRERLRALLTGLLDRAR